MVTITNGERTFRITAGAVKPYECMGFHVATEEELEEMKYAQGHFNDAGELVGSMTSKNEGPENDTEDGQNKEPKNEDGISTGDAAFIEEILEKPLTQWSNDEVKDFVRIKGIDTSGAQKVSQVRAIIKNYLEEQTKNA